MRRGEGPVVSAISARGFRIDDAVFPAVVLTPRQAAEWRPPPIAAIDGGALAIPLALDPPAEFLVLGTGARLVRPPPAFVAAIEARGLGIEVMDSRAAARAWGLLRAEGRWITAALYPLE